MNENTMNQQNGFYGAGQLSAGEYQEKFEAAQAAHKPWAECTAEQKLDRLRDELMGARHMRRWEQERFGRIDEKLRHFEFHQHGIDGTVMVRARDMERGYGAEAQSIKSAFDPLA